MQTFLDLLPLAKEKMLDNIKQIEVALLSDKYCPLQFNYGGLNI